MLRQGANDVRIVGRLNEIDLKENDSRKDNRHYISGRVNFLVEHTVSGQSELEIIPVRVFAFEKTNAGNPNPAYENAYEIMTKGTSVAATGDATKADTYEVTSARLQENSFISREDTIVSYPEINGSFFRKMRPGDKPESATFEAEIVIANMTDEIIDEMPTGRLVIDGLVIQYNGKPDKIRFIVENKNAIDYISQNWQIEDTVRISGKIRFHAETVEVQSAATSGFGEAPVRERTRTVREFVIDEGSPAYDEERKYDCEEVANALAEKKRETETRLREQQKNSNSGGVTTSRPSNRLNRGF